MKRYLLKFEKTGQLRYTSHLDIMRLFKRNFKRAGIDLVYSKGFNPQPKISFAQALSLGYESKSEYLEIETQRAYPTDQIIGLVNSHLPYGIKVLDCEEMDFKEKKIAASVTYAEYEVILNNNLQLSNDNVIKNFLLQDEIIIERVIKKKNKKVQVNIRERIEELSIRKDTENQIIEMRVKSGSAANLNPEVLITSLFKFDNQDISKGDLRITRTGIFKKDGKPFL